MILRAAIVMLAFGLMWLPLLYAEPWQCWPQFHATLPLCKSLGLFQFAMTGPDGAAVGCKQQCYDVDNDGDIDLWDWAEFQVAITHESYTSRLGGFESCGWPTRCGEPRNETGSVPGNDEIVVVRR